MARPTWLAVAFLVVPLLVRAAELVPAPTPAPVPAGTPPPRRAMTLPVAAPSPSLAPDAGSAIAPPAATSPGCALELGAARDAPSSVCMRCHDGNTGGSFEHGGHRVEVSYDPSRAGLRPKPEERPLNVVLPGGRITCMTCHDARSSLVSHLAAPTSGPAAQRLCVACHLFD